ncbi:MAG: hypothetical protein QOH47_2611 [Sphingomonadales bacterium]|jgi:hypothetical protein|nr:hypothetical protein [Sphingomonadales bacterium]
MSLGRYYPIFPDSSKAAFRVWKHPICRVAACGDTAFVQPSKKEASAPIFTETLSIYPTVRPMSEKLTLLSARRAARA